MDNSPGSRRNAILGHIDSRSLRIIICRTSDESFNNNNKNNVGELGTHVPPTHRFPGGSAPRSSPTPSLSLPIGLICDFNRFEVLRDAGYDVPDLKRLNDYEIMDVALDFIEFGVSPSVLSQHTPKEVPTPRSELPPRLQKLKHPPVVLRQNPESRLIASFLSLARSSVTKNLPSFGSHQIYKGRSQFSRRESLLEKLNLVESERSRYQSFSPMNLRALLLFGVDLHGVLSTHFLLPHVFMHSLGLARAIHVGLSALDAPLEFLQRKISRVGKSRVVRYCRNRFLSGKDSDVFSLTLFYYRKMREILRQHKLSLTDDIWIVKSIKNSLSYRFSLETLQTEFPSVNHLIFPLFPPRTDARLSFSFVKNENCPCVSRHGPKVCVDCRTSVRPNESTYPDCTIWCSSCRSCTECLDPRTRLYYSLLQSKNLCHPVTETFMEEALKKHQDRICEPEDRDLPSHLIELMEEVSIDFGKIVGQIYDPFHSVLPPSTAVIGTPRSRGGLKQRLIDEGILTNSRPSVGCRAEPFVIGLFGPPGSGKSLTVVDLVNHFVNRWFLKGDWRDYVYYRSSKTQFWDGYRQQPILIYDDLGQTTDFEDIKEFDLCVSTSDYYVPMAHLEEKGILMTSQLVIVTSNLIYGEVPRIVAYKSDQTLIEPMSLWRRFHLPIEVRREAISAPLSEKRGDYRELPKEVHYYLINPDFSVAERRRADMVRLDLHGRPTDSSWDHTTQRHQMIGPHVASFDLINSHSLLSLAFDRFSNRRPRETSRWDQECFSGTFLSLDNDSCPTIDFLQSGIVGESGCFLSFPSQPPVLRPSVKVVALSEPLKTRVITVGSHLSRCLKPFQRALWESLGRLKPFCLVRNEPFLGFRDKERDHNTYYRTPTPLRPTWSREMSVSIESECQRMECMYPPESGFLWLSGDFDAATDGFIMSCSSILLEGILHSVSHRPTKDWARWEVSPCRVNYPWGEGLQHRGQLMGGILSFPLLCLANYSLCRAVGLVDDQFLINGDDLLARVTIEQYHRWKELGPSMGLYPSLGKNYLSPNFGLINSQMYLSTEERVVVSGKLSLIAREGKPLAECYSYAKVLYPSTGLESLFKILNTPLLMRTPRSLRVPVRWGGLSSRFESGFNQSLAKKVYLFYLLRKTVNNKVRVPGTKILLVPLPVFVFDENKRRMCENEKYARIGRMCYQWRFLDPPNLEKDVFEDLTHGEMENFFHSLPVNLQPVLDSRVHISSFPPLDRVAFDWRPLPEKNWLAFKANVLSSLVLRLRMISEGQNVDVFDFDPEIDFSFPHFSGPLEGAAPDLPSFGRPSDIPSVDPVSELAVNFSDMNLGTKRSRQAEDWEESLAHDEDSLGFETDPGHSRILPLSRLEAKCLGWSLPSFGLIVPSDHFYQEPSSLLVRHGLGNLSIFHERRVERTSHDWSLLEETWSDGPDGLTEDELWGLSYSPQPCESEGKALGMEGCDGK